jgi:pyridoxamine 5'-phosphate oxidase
MSERWIPLDVSDCDPNPFVQFSRWFDEAAPEMREREAIALITATPDGHPSARMVLLRHIDDHSFGWYTNYESRKGRELEANPHASLLWYCEPLGRQIRIDGVVSKMTDAESDAYFASRPRGHQLGAHASRQSLVIPSRASLEELVRLAEAEFEGRDVPRPEYWGGFRLIPHTIEFWQHRSDRLHDRVVYSLLDGAWGLDRQSP